MIKGAVQNSEKIAIKMLKKGNDFTEIQELTELSMKRIQQLASAIREKSESRY